MSLILVSNRIPITIHSENGRLTGHPSSGGLVSALEPLLKQHGGLWVGSGGTEDSPKIREILEQASEDNPYKYVPLFLTEEEQSKFYEGFSNEIIWPLFHDLQSRCNFDPTYWEFYERVNARFAERVEQVSKPDDLIWIQDYQLMLVGRYLRDHRPKARLAFFLHIPFPSPDIFAKLPWRQQVLENLLAHDLIGVQTGRDLNNLIACLRYFVAGVKISGRGEGRLVTTAKGKTHVEAFPISIDYESFDEQTDTAEVLHRAQQIKKDSHGLRIAVGVDRLDYTKGIPERLKAFAGFLKHNPEYHRKIALIQIVVPSRENIPHYDKLKQEVERLVAHVNGEFSEPGWIPINHIHRPVPREELIAIFRAADVALITPLKDGMNLVAKEYCAAQKELNGALVLSEFAGAAPELRGGAILVNPYDEVGVAAALKQALEMKTRDRRRRMLRLREQIRRADIHTWRDRVFAALERTAAAEV